MMDMDILLMAMVEGIIEEDIMVEGIDHRIIDLQTDRIDQDLKTL